MSLRVWLPLNGNINNQGSDNITMSGTPASYSSGKIGTAATWNGSTSNVVYNNTTDYNFTDNFSFALWICPNFTGSTSQYAFTVGRADGGGYGYGLQVASATQLRIRFGNNSVVIACNSNTWYHIAATISNAIIRVYVNGTLTATSGTTTTLPTYSDGNGLGLGCFHYSGNIYPYYGMINDFRIYDHVLSAKEVKEISKGLICHYPLDGNGKGKDNLLSDTNTADTNLFGYSEQTGGSTKTIEYDNGIPCIKVTRNDTAHSGWAYMWHSNLNQSAIKVSTTYTVSFDAIASGSGSIGFSGFMNGNATNNLSASTTAVQNTFNSSDWSHIVLQTVTKSSFDDLTIGSQVVYMGCGYMNNANVWIKVKNFKVEEGIVDTPWCPNSTDDAYNTLGYNNTIEYDTSGYKNNGTRTNIEVSNVNSPKYPAVSYFKGSSYIACGRNTMVTDAITINAWVYSSNWTNYVQTLASCTESGGWSFGISGSNFNWYMGTGTSSNTYKTISIAASTFTAGWHMITVTYDGLAVKGYVDAVLKGTNAAYTEKTPIFYNASNGVFIGAEAGGNQTTPAGSYSTCNMSDFRIYAAALSADDIQELYQTSASITNNGAVMCYEFNEE